ncbi:MAG: hypothetical protein PVSMB8_12190 [Vulcanimicrobiaceae bacterium]
MATKTGAGIGVTGMDLVGHTVADARRSIDFYRDVIGLPLSEENPQGAEFELADGTTFGVWQPPDQTWGPPHASIMFAVPDPHAAYENLKNHGVKMLMSEVMDGPNCSMFACEDPDGVQIIIHKRKSI